MTAFPTGPYVSHAFIAEKVLTETNNAHSYIRVIDNVNIEVHGPDAEGPMPIPVSGTLVIGLKAGEARGPFEVSVRLVDPVGLDQGEMHALTLNMEQAHEGVVMHLDFQLGLAEQGCYWFDVRGGDQSKLMTRIPLKINVIRFRSSSGVNR